MATFRARLRPPKRTLWLGVEVASMESKRGPSGRVYVKIAFTNCPLFLTLMETHVRWIREVLAQRGMFSGAFRPYDMIGHRYNMDVKWVMMPTDTQDVLCPRLYISPTDIADEYIRSVQEYQGPYIKGQF